MRGVGLVVVVSVAMLCIATEGFAHVFEHPKTLRLGIRGQRAYLSVSYDVDPGQDARRTRALFDRDTDGRLDPEERQRLEKGLERRARVWLRTERDGEPLDWTIKERKPHRFDRPTDDATTLGLALLYEAELPKAPLTLTIHDRERDKAKHVPLIVDLGPKWVVDFASQGELSADGARLSRVRLADGRPLVLRLRPSVGSRVPR